MKKISISFLIVFAAVSLHGAIVFHYSADIVIALLVACLFALMVSGAYFWQAKSIDAKIELERENQNTIDKRNEQVSIAMNSIMQLALGLFTKKSKK